MSASIEESSKFGYSDVELRNLESVYRSDLFTGKKIIVSGAAADWVRLSPRCLPSWERT